MRLTSSILGAAVVASATAVSACGGGTATVDTEPTVVVVEPTGDLTVTWTVAGTDDPGACDFYFADAAELAVYDSVGRLVADEFARCDDFALTLELAVDTYQADMLLVDVNDDPVSTTLPLDDLRVTDGTELVVDVDFPDDSML